MRVAVYNQMFGLNGKNLFSNILGHWAVHYQSNPGKIWKRASIDKTQEIIKKSNAEIIGICEILEGQEKELAEKLGEIGYKYVYFGNGHKTKFNKLRIKVAIASKVKCISREIKGFPVIDSLGGGGGFLHCYVPEKKLDILCIHFAIMQKKELYEKQMDFLFKLLRKSKKSVLLGDFNKSYAEIKNYFSDFILASEKIKTCSLTPIMKSFHWRDDDHILVKGVKIKKAGFLEGASDHRLIYADLK